MKPRNSIWIAVIAAICVIASVRSVDARDYWFGLMWDIGIPTQDTRDFIDQPGFLGISMEGWSYRNPNFSTGFILGWQNFYEKTDEILQIDNITISGTQVRYIDFVPIMFGARYLFLTRYNRIRPFVGAKAGTYYIKQRLEIGGLNVILSKGWHLGLAPEAGITFLTPWLDVFGFIRADYNYAFSRDDSIDFSYLGLSIGFMYIL